MHNLKNSRILVTGGAGLVGSHIIDQLLKKDVAEVVVVDDFSRGTIQNLEAAINSNKVKICRVDIRDAAALDELFKGIDYCFHMAAIRITQCAQNPKEALEVMINGTFNVIESCLRHKVNKLVAASSASIYGMADSFPTHEHHHPYNNRTLYGGFKTANEQMYRAFFDMKALNYVALRYFNIYGPRMDTHGKYTEVLIRWVHLLKEGKPPLIYGDGSQTMDFIHVEDVARANILALESEVSDQVFNIASAKEVSLKQLCETLMEAMAVNIHPEFISIPDDRKKVEVVRRLADVSKAKKLIGFEASITLNEGLKDLVSWLSGLNPLNYCVSNGEAGSSGGGRSIQ